MIVSKQINTSCHCQGTVQSGTREGNWEKVVLKVRPEDSYQSCRCEVTWQTVPVWWGRMQSLTSINICHLTKFWKQIS